MWWCHEIEDVASLEQAPRKPRPRIGEAENSLIGQSWMAWFARGNSAYSSVTGLKSTLASSIIENGVIFACSGAFIYFFSWLANENSYGVLVIKIQSAFYSPVHLLTLAKGQTRLKSSHRTFPYRLPPRNVHNSGFPTYVNCNTTSFLTFPSPRHFSSNKAKMTTAAACATIPAVVVTGYAEKGEWIELAGLKTYVTGSPSSTKAIVDVYDIFGPAPQTLQGADLLATALGALVIVPDFFKGSYMKSEWMADSSEEVGKLKGAFMAVAGEFAAHSAKIGAVVAAGREKWNIESWGALGLCWGGKVAVLSSGEGSPFKVTGQVHPG